MRYVKNKDNRLFNLSYRYDYGKWHNKWLDLIPAYLSYVGTDGYTATDISHAFYRWGCSFSANGSNEHFVIGVNGPEEYFDSAVWLLEKLMNNPMVDESVYQSMIADVMKSRSDAKSNPAAVRSALLSYAMYGPNNPSKWVLSNDELTQPVVYFTHYDQVQASINWYSRGSVLAESESPVVSAFNQYFGGDMSSVVFQNIREAKALAYSTYAVYRPGMAKGKYNSMVGFVGTQADKFHDAVAAMNELMTTLPENAEVFELAKKSLANQLETNRLDRSSYIATYDMNVERGFSTVVPNMANYAKMSTLGMTDIANFHKERVSGKPYTLVVVADRARVGKTDLAKYGKVVDVEINELFGY
jgi:predicted Zn-dependent peptidase